jgi:hypothetical protein
MDKDWDCSEDGKVLKFPRRVVISILSTKDQVINCPKPGSVHYEWIIRCIFLCTIFQTTWDLWTDPILQSIESLCMNKRKRTGHIMRNALTDTINIDAETRSFMPYTITPGPIFYQGFRVTLSNP